MQPIDIEAYAKAIVVANAHSFYNPCELDTPQWIQWQAGVVWALLGRKCPKNPTPALWEGFEYGQGIKVDESVEN